jgi:succinoglycan biosynthesis transport protein ExoP
MEFTLKDIMDLLMKRMIFIIAITMFGFISLFVYNRFIVKPSYTATMQMYVNTNNDESIANLSDLSYAQKLVNTYINFLQTKTFFNQVADASGLNYTKEQIKLMTQIKSINNTEIFEISVISNNPQDAFHIVKTMEVIAPDLIKSIKYSAQISVVDPAVLPSAPSGPNVFANTIMGGLSAFIFSIALALLWEVLDVKLKNQESLANKYQIPLLGVIPNFHDNTEHRIKSYIRKLHGETKDGMVFKEGISENKKFIVTEAYKSLRTNLFVSIRKEGCKKIIISSPVPEDGKSTTTYNIGLSIAQTGARVIILDCDLRKGTLHQFFNVRRRPGVSDFLSGLENIDNLIYPTTYENLKIIPMGRILPNPSELLGSVYMKDLLDKLEYEYDYIIIDTPPINVVSDAVTLVKLVDGVVLVVREKVTTYPNINNAIQKCRFVNATIIGFVINGVYVNSSTKSKYDYYYNGDFNDFN